MSHGLLALIAAPVVLFLLVVCIREPMRIALPLFAALVPFGGGLSVGPSRYGSLSSLIGFILGVGLAMQLVSARRGARRISPTVPVWILFLGGRRVFEKKIITPSTSISDFLILASLILVFVFVSLSQVDRVVLRRTENGLLAGASAAAIYGFTQLIFLGGLPSDVPGVGASPEGRVARAPDSSDTVFANAAASPSRTSRFMSANVWSTHAGSRRSWLAR